tara:strand:- start:74 stop:217 length:144 start_codon:yes stop_codon:yes gene_type:complete
VVVDNEVGKVLVLERMDRTARVGILLATVMVELALTRLVKAMVEKGL